MGPPRRREGIQVAVAAAARAGVLVRAAAMSLGAIRVQEARARPAAASARAGPSARAATPATRAARQGGAPAGEARAASLARAARRGGAPAARPVPAPAAAPAAAPDRARAAPAGCTWGPRRRGRPSRATSRSTRRRLIKSWTALARRTSGRDRRRRRCRRCSGIRSTASASICCASASTGPAARPTSWAPRGMPTERLA